MKRLVWYLIKCLLFVHLFAGQVGFSSPGPMRNKLSLCNSIEQALIPVLVATISSFHVNVESNGDKY